MADDVTLPGDGSVIGADLVSGVYYQRVKMLWGADGAVNDTSAAAPLPVTLGGKSIAVTLTVTNGAYTVADVAGGLITFANATRANAGLSIINSVKLAGVVAIPYELWLFNADIATGAADNAAFTLVAADVVKCLGVIPIATADYCAAQSAFNVATVRGVGLEVLSAATTSLYAYLKCTATTSPGTTTLTLTLDVEYLS